MSRIKFIVTKLLFAACLLLLTSNANATDDPEITRIFSGATAPSGTTYLPLISGAVDELVDDIFYNNAASILNPSNDKITNVISLLVREADLYKIKTDFTASVKIKIDYTLINGSTGTINSTILAITYTKAGGLKYNARQTLKFDQCRKVKITILEPPTTNVNISSWNVWEVVNLENRMLRKRDYVFAANDVLHFNTTIPPTPATTLPNGADEVPISWSEADPFLAKGKTHIDVEWTWVDAEALANYMLPNPANNNVLELNADLLFKNNASRITVDSKKYTSYTIPLIYDGKGKLFYRIRPLQLKEDEQVINGVWSASGFTGIVAYEIVADDAEHVRSLNWQTTTSFAEEGKRKTVVQYFDGTLRGRQTVTKDNVTNKTVVAESFYDFQGRPTINILPAPTMNSVIKYTADFNKFIGGFVTPKEAFDLMPTNVNPCNYETPRLDKNNANGGAAQYYSDQNPQKTIGFNKFIPDADGYAFTETRYTPDATGRIETQGGVGGTFQLGKGGGINDHDTKYYYGKPFQEELDALFGTEAGDANHYSKNMVRDANGQYSVSYVDMHGRTVATALAGKSPANLKPLASYAGAPQTLTKHLITPTNNNVEGRSIVSSSTIVVAQAGPHQFHYVLEPLSAEILACQPAVPPGSPQQTVCYDCYYNLEIRITVPCGGETIVETASNLHFVNNLPVYDQTCNNNLPAAIVVDFTKNLVEGEYNITKTLTVNKQAQDWYRDEVYKNRNICKTFEDFYNEIYAEMILESSECIICKDCDPPATKNEGKLSNIPALLSNIGLPLKGTKQSVKNKIVTRTTTTKKITSRAGGGTNNVAPSNDLCDNAETLIVNPDYNCGVLTSGNDIEATISSPRPSCEPITDDLLKDVWYKFTATNSTHRVSIEAFDQASNLVARSSGCGIFLTIYGGVDCNNLVELSCLGSSPYVSNLTNLVIGNTYTVRINTYGGCNTEFALCVGTPPPIECISLPPTCESVCGQSKNVLEAIRDAMLEDMTPDQGQYARLNADLNENGVLENYLSDYDRYEMAETQPYNIFNLSYSPQRYKSPLDENGTALSGFLDEDGQPDPEGTVALVNAMSNDQFTENFKPSWANALLPHHPEYCKLRILETDPHMVDSYKRDAIIEETDTWAAALAAGFIDENEGVSILNADPFFNCGDRQIPYRVQMLDFINTNFNQYPVSGYPAAGQTAVPLSFWKIAYMSVFCDDHSVPTPTSSCAVDAPLSPGGFLLTSMCEADKDKMWVIFRTLFLSEKERMVNDWLNLQCASIDYATMATNHFERRFGKAPDYYTAANHLQILIGGASSTSDDTQAAGLLFAEYGETCEAYKERWAQKLRECSTIKALDVTTIVAGEEVVTNSFIDALLDRLKDICQYTSDDNHTMGASSFPSTPTVPPLPTPPAGTPVSFQAAFTAQWVSTFGTTGQTVFCNEDLIDFPQPYNHQSPLSDETIESQKDDCVCTRLTALELERTTYNTANGATLTLSAYILRFHGTIVRQTLLDSLTIGCDAVLNPSCNSYESPVEIPAILSCETPINNCVDCDAFALLVTEFKNKYPSTTLAAGVIYENPTDDQLAANKALATFINNRTGLTKTWGEYLEFKNQCELLLTCRNCTPPLMCLEVMFPDVEEEEECNDYIKTLAYNEAVEQYNEYLTGEINFFENTYLNKCLEAKNHEVFTVKAILTPTDPPAEYHYTLYYYDQAGNLVKTVPPEGVRANFSLAHSEDVKLKRSLGQDVFMPHMLPTQYRYNTLNQVVQQKSPDGGLSKFWYDQLGRLVISQNAKQRNQIANTGYFSYTRYDNLGRIIEVGEKRKRDVAQTGMTQPIAQGLDPVSLDTWLTPSGLQPLRQITKTVYDDVFTPLNTNGLLEQKNMRNRVSHSYVQALDNGTAPPNTGNPLDDAPWESATFYSYDIHGNVDVLLQDYKKTMGLIVGNRFKKMTYKYDLISGKVNEVAYQPGQADAFYHRYMYDAENKLTDVQTSKEYVYWENDAHYDYYRHGPMARTTLGHLEVQGVDYAYTLQGWLKGVNTTALKRPTYIGGGEDCGDYSAVENLYIYNRPSYSPNYIAKTSINFMPSLFTSLDPDNFVAYIDPNITSCNTDGNAGDEIYEYTNDGKYDMGQDGQTDATGAFVPTTNPTVYGNNTKVADAYGYSLNYFNGDYNRINTAASNPFTSIAMKIPTLNASNPFSAEQLFNGNIGAMVVSIPKLGRANVYGYNYDQLNRIVNMDVFNGLNNATNTFTPFAISDYREAVSYDANGNIKTYLRNGHNNPSQYGPANLQMDNLTYQYEKDVAGNIISNKLRYVHDQVAATNYGEDIDSQTPLNLTGVGGVQTDFAPSQANDNYAYDDIGNLIKDTKEGITNIEWTVYGKISTITKVKDGVTTIITYTYDASGNRITKAIDKGAGDIVTTYYVRDASGNVMSVYNNEGNSPDTRILRQKEIHLYGSSRLGVYNVNVTVQTETRVYTTMPGNNNQAELFTFERGNKFFELSNHLGNVLVTVSDKKLAVSANGTTIDYYTADVVTANDYYPFGSQMPGRKFSQPNSSYRYGFNGQENSDEIAAGLTTALYWEYDSRIGRRWNVDPVLKVWESPYLTFSGNPISSSDIHGNLANNGGGDPPPKSIKHISLGDPGGMQKDLGVVVGIYNIISVNNGAWFIARHNITSGRDKGMYRDDWVIGKDALNDFKKNASTYNAIQTLTGGHIYASTWDAYKAQWNPVSIAFAVTGSLGAVVSTGGRSLAGSSAENEMRSLASKNIAREDATEVIKPNSVFKGGAKGELFSKQNILEANHIPSMKAYELAGLNVSYNTGSAFQMLYAEHRAYISTGRSAEAVAFRAQEAALLRQGKYTEAFDLNATRIRAEYGTKYNEAINEARTQYNTKIIPFFNKKSD
jgi:hypothetical protein